MTCLFFWMYVCESPQHIQPSSQLTPPRFSLLSPPSSLVNHPLQRKSSQILCDVCDCMCSIVCDYVTLRVTMCVIVHPRVECVCLDHGHFFSETKRDIRCGKKFKDVYSSFSSLFFLPLLIFTHIHTYTYLHAHTLLELDMH